ncbi:MAG: peptidoglycan-binding protein, partial [Oscillospiraceae bacterium]|nr:peptidoglycan-binding protein [Oscillospiraceae bacterium]
MNTNAPANPAPERGGQPIRSLQYMLNQLAIHNDILTRLAVDGIFGERTLEAVMVFQRENGLPVTGVVDLTTWNAIRNAYIHMELMYGFPPALNVLPNGTYTAVEGQECEV